MNLAGLSLRDLEYIAAVAEQLHFGRAALACGVSQPTLSGQLRKLEEFLGVEIFERSPRGVLVTRRGEEIIAQTKRIISEARRLFEVVRIGAEPLTGTLRLGVISTLGPYLVPFLLKPLRARYPDLKLMLHEGHTRVLVRQLEEGELDALLATSPIAEAELTELPLFREELALAVPPGDHDVGMALIAALLVEEGLGGIEGDARSAGVADQVADIRLRLALRQAERPVGRVLILVLTGLDRGTNIGGV
jgi:LysR family hydrogen peroxide-inducible transcriptional activator